MNVVKIFLENKVNIGQWKISILVELVLLSNWEHGELQHDSMDWLGM